MEIARKRRPGEIVLGLYLLSHPVPVLFHVIAVAVFTLLAAWPRPIWGTIALVIAAHAVMQISIAMINDYCDRQADAVGKSSKPIPRGLVYPHEALLIGLFLIVVMIVLLLPLNPLALVISLIYLALGQSYNLGLKSTPLSGIVFALAMPLIPLYAFAGVDHMLPVLLWLIPGGFLLGVALNLANSLPDIEEDAASHARTLAVVLGVKRAFLACQLLIVFAAILIAVLTVTRIVPAQSRVVLPTVLFVLLMVGTLSLLFGPTKPRGSRKTYFYLATLTCLILVGGWFVGVIA